MAKAQRKHRQHNDNGAGGGSGSGRALPGQVVLVLQGGGALGAYQAGVYEALHEAGIEPDWVIGTSIGAINAALICGNEPQQRLARIRDFWERVERHTGDDPFRLQESLDRLLIFRAWLEQDTRHDRGLRKIFRQLELLFQERHARPAVEDVRDIVLREHLEVRRL